MGCVKLEHAVRIALYVDGRDQPAGIARGRSDRHRPRRNIAGCVTDSIAVKVTVP